MGHSPLNGCEWSSPHYFSRAHSVPHWPSCYSLDKAMCIHLKAFVLNLPSVWSAFLLGVCLDTSIRPSLVVYLRLQSPPQPSPPRYFIHLLSIYHYHTYLLTSISASPWGQAHFFALTARYSVLTQSRDSVDNYMCINSFSSHNSYEPRFVHEETEAQIG